MKYLLLLILILWATPVEAAVTWESYDSSGAVKNNYDVLGESVYMIGNGLNPNKTYNVRVWDASGNISHVASATDIRPDSNGVLRFTFRPVDIEGVVPGVWTAKLFNVWNGQVAATDTFTVQASAIPEIPDVLAGIGVAGLCGLIYWKFRKQ